MESLFEVKIVSLGQKSATGLWGPNRPLRPFHDLVDVNKNRVKTRVSLTIFRTPSQLPAETSGGILG